MYEIECGGAVARSITIRQPTTYLTLCEVKAYGKPSDEVPLQNVASGKILFDYVHHFLRRSHGTSRLWASQKWAVSRLSADHFQLMAVPETTLLRMYGLSSSVLQVSSDPKFMYFEQGSQLNKLVLDGVGWQPERSMGL